MLVNASASPIYNCTLDLARHLEAYALKKGDKIPANL